LGVFNINNIVAVEVDNLPMRVQLLIMIVIAIFFAMERSQNAAPYTCAMEILQGST
tara:strand:- start:722 stop:889 length:168 start_codon:yes stop_codon:yes gene_type:complete